MSASANAVLSEVSIVLAGVTAAATLYFGWRKRISDAARLPFLTGEAAIADAKSALEFRAQRIEELTRSEAALKAQLEQALATAKVQQEQLVGLQARLYTLEGEKRDLMARADTAEEDGRRSRIRITELEERLEGLQRKLSLGPDGGF